MLLTGPSHGLARGVRRRKGTVHVVGGAWHAGASHAGGPGAGRPLGAHHGDRGKEETARAHAPSPQGDAAALEGAFDCVSADAPCEHGASMGMDTGRISWTSIAVDVEEEELPANLAP